MSSNTSPTTNLIPERELRSKTSSSISFETPTRNKNRYNLHGRSKPTTTSTPTLSRKIVKPNLRRSNSAKTSSSSSKTMKKVTLAEDNDRNQPDEPNDEMDQDVTEQTASSNFDTNQIISDSIINDNPVNENQNETVDFLNNSNETVDEQHQIRRTTTAKKKDIMNYFTKQPNGGFKCTLCANSDKVFSKTNENSDSNLRSHLGKMHRMIEFLYPSQKNQYQPKLKIIPNEEKKTLDDVAIEAIIQDALPFNHFRKRGMAKFLSIIKPGYVGPHRKTVHKRLANLYQKRREFMKQKLSSIQYISLTTDVWKSPKRQYFICLTCHYLTTTYENDSFVLSFRKFAGKHSGQKFRSFINNELRKMNLELKVCSITTDGGPDIKAATAGAAEFGMRIGCCAHKFNLVVKHALWLFDKGSSKNSKSSSTTISSKPHDDNNDETESCYDSEEIGEDVSDNDYNSDSSDDNDSSNDSTNIYLSIDEEYSDSSDDDENEYTNEEQPLSQPNDNNQRRTNDEITAELVSDPDSLTLFVYNLLQRVRCLIKFIRTSDPLDRYIRNQIHLKKIEINRRLEEKNTQPIKLNDIVMDFRIRWNTTYVMLSRFIAISSIITDITLSPSISIGLKKKQYEKLRKLSFTRFDWLCLSALEDILYPFYHATTLLSGSKYPTLSIGYSVLTALKNFLTTTKRDQALENALKQILLIQFNYYFEQETSWEQKCATLIAAFLDPTTYRLLNDEDIRKAEQLILSEFDVYQSVDRLRIETSSITIDSISSSTSPYQITSNSTGRQKIPSLDQFYRMCEMPSLSNSTTTSIKKQLSFKEELCHYMATARTKSSFINYWCQHEVLLPQLSQFVKRYNCIPCTSVPSESAFSIAGHIQRKARASLSSTALRYLMILRN